MENSDEKQLFELGNKCFTTTHGILESCSSSFANFIPVKAATVCIIIMASPSKSYPLGPMPTHLVKHCTHALLMMITNFANNSLSSGEFLSNLKSSRTRPSLKKQIIDEEVFTNFRLIVKLSFLSKAIERMLVDQTSTYLTDIGLCASTQCAYRNIKST